MAHVETSPEEAARLFVQSLFVEAYQGSISVMDELLRQGPPGREPWESHARLHDWFVGLGEADQERVAAVIVETARTAIFECLAVLDGVVGGHPVPDTISDYALYLNTYADEAAWLEDQSQAAVRINHPNRTWPDLHDSFMELWPSEA